MSKQVAKTAFPKSTVRRTVTTDEPEWLQKCELTFRRTGKLNLAGVPQLDLTAIRSRPSLKELNLSKTKLKSIQGLAVQRNITVFTADNSELESFVNFSAIANASIYSLKNTPLSKTRFFRIAIALLSNSPKPIINGGLISDAEKKKVGSYPQFTGELLNLGWQLVYPCPEPDEIRELCRQYNVTYVEDSPTEDVPAQEAPEVEPAIGDSDYLAQIEWLMGQHNEIIVKAAKKFELLDESEDKFQAEIKEIITKRMRWSFTDGKDLDDQILAAVTELCLARERQ